MIDATLTWVATYSCRVDKLSERLHAQGMRLTRQRERVLQAVGALGHATPDEVLARVAADGGAVLPASTIYRCLDALEGSGMVRHTHLDHRAPSYQLADHDDHIHLVCRDCGRVEEVPAETAATFAAAIRDSRGFAPELTHTAIHGRCALCRT